MNRKVYLIALLLYPLTAGAQDVTSVKIECETLMNSALPFAEQMLKQHGEFFPYGAALNSKGSIVSVAAYEGEERPRSTEVIRLLKQAFVRGASSGEYKATALVYDVKVTLPSSSEKSDAISVSLNHRDSYSIIIVIPYVLKNGQLTLGEVFAQKGEADVFPPGK
jgi:hypothetical protein